MLKEDKKKIKNSIKIYSVKSN